MEDMDSIFKTNRKEWFDNPLKELGFKPYKSNCLARVTAGDIFQVLQFQKDAHGTPQFCINIFIRPLFCNNEYLTLKPGFRLTEGEKADQWYSFKDNETAESSFKLAYDLFLEKALPFYKSTIDAESIAKAFESKKQTQIGWGYSPWLEFDMGLLYLKTGDFAKSFTYLEIASDKFSNDSNTALNKYGSYCEEILHSLGDTAKVNQLIDLMKKKSIANLRLEKIMT